MHSSPARRTTTGMPITFEDDTSYNSASYAANASTDSTAYRGSQGYVNLSYAPRIALDKDGFEDLYIGNTTPTKEQPTLRQNLSSRLFSTLQSAQPAAAALSRSSSVLHSRAKSLAASYVPKLNQQSPTGSPSTPRGERAEHTPSNRLFGDIFHGESAPIRLGVATSPPRRRQEREAEEAEEVMEYRGGFTERPERPKARRTPTALSTTSVNSRTSWFGRKSLTPVTPAAPTTTSTAAPADELLGLDISVSLFPHGPADPLSPHAFNDLLLNATSLLQRLQAAYKEKVDYIASIQPEIDAQREEVEETETRAQHLKMQLEDLSRQAQEQLQNNRDLAEELAQEKSRNRTVRLVRQDSHLNTARRAGHEDIEEEENDADDDDTPRRRKRGSAASASDSGFESDADSASILSSGIETPPLHYQMPHQYQHRLPITPEYEVSPQWTSPAAKTVISARDRMAGFLPTSIRGMNKSPLSAVVGVDGNTSGEKRDELTWSTVQRLKGENVCLKSQVEEMQRALQGCIDFVGTVGLV